MLCIFLTLSSNCLVATKVLLYFLSHMVFILAGLRELVFFSILNKFGSVITKFHFPPNTFDDIGTIDNVRRAPFYGNNSQFCKYRVQLIVQWVSTVKHWGLCEMRSESESNIIWWFEPLPSGSTSSTFCSFGCRARTQVSALWVSSIHK